MFKKGMDLYIKGKYGSAQYYFKVIIDNYDESFTDLKTTAEFYNAICSIELFNKDAEYLITRFIEKHPGKPDS